MKHEIVSCFKYPFDVASKRVSPQSNNNPFPWSCHLCLCLNQSSPQTSSFPSFSGTLPLHPVHIAQMEALLN